ncbi:hypothetical protein [Raineyella sp. LH-20]|uniref:hypothetical protein n=1 Tax=Raineyella sp. LH-20 TaxID=3081204 RepID=UPI0029531DE9|nr:hypothetical protein [Raineyella sp. LH-20]WOP20058.1 hypothetical protein R0146_07220 [Raineyella sp. LH-20]
MSRYQLQQCLFDHLRRLEEPDTTARPDQARVEGYDLTDAERTALTAGDVAAFHTHAVHPVLINAYCRANGWKRADYRVLFPAGSDVVTGETRWQGFGSRADGRLDAYGRFHLGQPVAAAPAATAPVSTPGTVSAPATVTVPTTTDPSRTASSHPQEA